MPPCVSFHCQTRWRNFSRPRSSRCLISPDFFRCVPRPICVAMPAWSVPGSQRTSRPVHARLAGENILDRIVQNVPEREHAGDVGRRNDNGVSRLARMRIGAETTPFQPKLIPFLLDRLGDISFGNFGHISGFQLPSWSHCTISIPPNWRKWPSKVAAREMPKRRMTTKEIVSHREYPCRAAAATRSPPPFRRFARLVPNAAPGFVARRPKSVCARLSNG